MKFQSGECLLRYPLPFKKYMHSHTDTNVYVSFNHIAVLSEALTIGCPSCKLWWFNGRVIYVDIESNFSSTRMAEGIIDVMDFKKGEITMIHEEGPRFNEVANSPLSPPLAFYFIVNSSGISLLSDDRIQSINGVRDVHN
ncbi:hypothetical protein NE237_004912 [Protea cynaroides]|uniref:Uncharacterized protein n=1 Tax=Protea cynaroides TaxID=273540 RepID=A0A9Q0KJL7_9MAGN|nr:hypothetical protein NE237_004912 [Protea cynaroides]